MATLKKDGTYSWRARAIVVRDARHVHNGPDVTSGPPARSKDTKRWCKGHVGREHKIVAQVMADKGYLVRAVQFCSACGREFDQYYKVSFLRNDPPEWMTPELHKQLEQAEHERTARRRRQVA